MTVKLAKLFGSSSNSSSNSNSSNNNNNKKHSMEKNSQSSAPPLPPPNANMKHKYYDHQPAAIYGNAYEDDDDIDDYDDNMSLYSSSTTAGSACMQRSHPYNNSQRPLLGERKPHPSAQLLAKKKLSSMQQQQQHQQQQQQQQQQLPPTPPPPLHLHQLNANGDTGVERAYISPYVQQQKRDSAKGLHGFNDFDTLSQQYTQHLQSPHIGYPYGSPPSPTAQSSDFVFEPFGQQPQQQPLHHGKAVSTSSTGTSKSNCSSTSTSPAAVGSMPRYGNVGYQYGRDQDVYYASSQHQQQQQQEQEQEHQRAAYLGHPSRFEDDFCTRRNVDFVVNHPNQNAGIAVHPFIFGISHEQQQTDYGHERNLPVHIDKNLNLHQSPNTVINARTISSSASSMPAANPMSVKEHNPLQQSLSDTSADSGKGAKFLLRKRKSKKTPTTTTTTTTAASTNSEHKGKQQLNGKVRQLKQPTIKCVLVGDGAVGKTNLILSYLENRFNPEHVPTASDIYNADVMVNDSPVHLTLCDTAGQDTLDPLRELCYPDSDVFLLCFSVVKPETFHAIKAKWAPKFAKTKASLILVGTQADLRGNLNVLNKLQTNGEKPISYADAWDLAKTIGAKYIETSSATQDKVKDVFDAAIWEGLVPTTLPPTPSFWRKLFCLA